MSNSPLVSFTRLSPNNSGKRTHPIDRISPHCLVGHCSLETIGAIFANPSQQSSCNYAIDDFGHVGMYVEEGNRSWCTSSKANDQRAVTIEIASDTVDPYKITDGAYQGLIKLMVDVCKRNGKNRVIWLGDKAKSLAYEPASNEMLITVHRWFKNKACPGDYIYERLGAIADEVNAKLTSSEAKAQGNTVPFMVHVNIDDLNIRKGPGTNYSTTGTYTGIGAFTIVEVLPGEGSKKGWGLLKSGEHYRDRWVSLDYVTRI